MLTSASFSPGAPCLVIEDLEAERPSLIFNILKIHFQFCVSICVGISTCVLVPVGSLFQLEFQVVVGYSVEVLGC